VNQKSEEPRAFH